MATMEHDYCRPADAHSSMKVVCDDIDLLGLPLPYEPGDSILNEDDEEMIVIGLNKDRQGSPDDNPATPPISSGRFLLNGSLLSKTGGKICYLCTKSYASQNSLNRHLTKIHKVNVTPAPRVLQCPVDKCESFYRHMESLREHLCSDHHIKLSPPVELKVVNMEEFFVWKADEEKRTHTKFVRGHGKYTLADGVHVNQFFCHRSGYHVPQSKGLRRLKEQGSIKMNAMCPAAVTAREHTNGTVDVEYYSTHVGHFTDLEELYMGRELRARYIKKVSDGATFVQMLDEVRDTLFGEVTSLAERSRRGMDEAKRLYGLLAGGEYVGGDEAGVQDFIQELETLGEDANPVILHRGTTTSSNFVVALMNRQQTTMLQRYGPDGILCIDDNSDTTAIPSDPKRADPFRFLVTLSVVTDDEQGRAIPCAFALTNRMDEPTMTTFYAAVRHQAGKITPRVLLLHDSPHLGAWRVAMGDNNNSNNNGGFTPLLTTWHTDAIWRRQLKKMVGRSYHKAAAYKALRVIMKQPDPHRLSLLMAALQRHLEENRHGRAFNDFLESMWGKRVALWALCHRDAATVRADMELEVLHVTLARTFTRERLMGQVETSLRVLLWQYGRGMTDPSSCMRHRQAVSVIASVVPAATSDGRKKAWTVRVSGGENKVERLGNDEVCTEGCPLLCIHCGLCVHTFVCTCTDNLVCGNFCRHLHLVGLLLRDGKLSEEDEEVAVQVEMAKTDAGAMDISSDVMDGGEGNGVKQPFVIVTQAELTPELIDRISTATFGSDGIACDPLEVAASASDEQDRVRREELMGVIVGNAQKIVNGASEISNLPLLMALNEELDRLAMLVSS